MIKIFNILPIKVKIYFFIGVFVIFLNVISALFLPFFLSQFVKLIAEGNSVTISKIFIFARFEIYSGTVNQVLGTLTWITFSLIFFSLITSIISLFITTWAGELASYHLRIKIFSKIQQLSLIDIVKFKPESLMNRISNDVAQYWDFLIGATSNLIKAPILVIGGSIFMVITDSYLSISILIIIPVLVFVLWIISKKTQPLLKLNQSTLDLITKEVGENVLGVRQIKIYNLQQKQIDKFHLENKKWLSLQKRINSIFSISYPVFFVLINIILVVIYSLAARFIISGEVGFEYLATILIFTDYNFIISFGILLLSQFLVLFFRAKVSCLRINEVFDLKHQELIVENGFDIVANNSEGCSIEFKNLNFKYYDKSKHFALKDINFRVDRGETLGIIGPTGSGKSTIVNLLMNNYKYNDGNIKINNLEVNQINSKSLHENIGIVFQDSLLYYGTIKSNLLFAKNDATDEEIKKALDNSCAINFIKTFEDGIEHKVIQGGNNLSGGQKQRLSIARTLLRNPKILIFDDSTSALDNVTTSKVLKNLKNNYRCTTILISQKINSIKHANKILVMDKSKIIDVGTHEELILKNNWYKHVYENQLEQ